MEESFLQFLILKDGTLIYGQEKLHYVQNNDIENYFKESVRKHLPKELKVATALSIVLIFICHEKECHDFITTNLSTNINFGDLIERCFMYLKREKLISPEQAFLLPSIQRPLRKNREYFREWNSSLLNPDLDFKIPSQTIFEILSSLSIFISFITNVQHHLPM